MVKNLRRVLIAANIILLASCGGSHSSDTAPNNSLDSGNHIVEVVADSALIIDKGVETGQAKFYLENKSDHLVNDISVHSTSANLVINDASECHKALAPHQTCAVIYTAKLAKDKNKDSANVSAIFIADQKYKSDGQVDMLRNPDIGDAQFVVVNTRARKNDDSELIIHGVGGNDNHKYTVSSVTVNGHKISLANNSLKKNGLQSTINGGENLTVLVPTEIVNDSDPYNSQMTMSLQGTIDGSPTNLMQSFLVADAPAGFVYEPTTGYLNPTYNLNIATVGVTPQTYSVNYIKSIPAGAVTDNTTHTFTASLQPTTTTSRNLQCSQLISFTSNSCQVQVTGSNGSSPATSKNNCTQTIVVDPTKWGNTSQYLQCQYVPQIEDSNGNIESPTQSGILTVNLSNINNPVSAAMLPDNAGFVTIGNESTGISYNGTQFSISNTPTSYRWVQIYNYESTESVLLNYQVPSLTVGNNANVSESPSAVKSVVGSSAAACSKGQYLSPGQNCYVVMQVLPTGISYMAGDAINLQVGLTSSKSGRVSYYTTNLYMQYSASFARFLGNVTTVMGGPNGTAFNESMPESTFITTSTTGGSTPADCGNKSSKGNTYQCIVQGSYLNVKLPQATGSFGLPSQFNYVLDNEDVLAAQGFKISYALANTATPAVPAQTWGVGTGGCKIPANAPTTSACYINVQNPWSPNNKIDGNIQLNIRGYFDKNPNIAILSNAVGFYALNPTSKVTSMYNYTSSLPYAGTADTQAGGDTYWNAGESWGLAWNAANPDSTSAGTGRFFLYRGDSKCVADKVTGLLWFNNVLVNQTVSHAGMLNQTPDISCGGIVVANAGLNNGAIARSRLPSLREMSSVVDFRYNQTAGFMFGFSDLNPTVYNSRAKQNGTATNIPSATALSSIMYYDLVYSASNIFSAILNAATVNNFTWNGTTWSNNLGSSISSGMPLLSDSAREYFNYVLVATLPTSELQPLQPLLKSIDPLVNSLLAGKVNCDAYCQESSGFRANNTNGGVGVTWPTRGNWPNEISNVTQNIYGKNRYVSDPTGSCMIDLATGLIFQQKFARSNFKGEDNNTDLAKTVTSLNRVNGAYYGLCGLKNWRGANIREVEATYNYAMDGQININLYKNILSSSGYAANSYFNPLTAMGISGLYYAANNDGGSFTLTNTISSGLNNSASSATAKRIIPLQEFGNNSRQYFALSNTYYGSGTYAYIPVAGGTARIQP